MKKIFFITLLATLFSSSVFSQDLKKDAVPKQYSFELGGRYIAASSFDNKASAGGTFLFDYAWQLSGFTRSNASFISVPLGYTILLPDTKDDKQMAILSYGWTVRHEIGYEKKVIPFFSYSLLLNQLRISGTEGAVFGHQTKFDFGINFKTSTRIQYFTKVEYSFTRYPKLGTASSQRMHVAELKFGFRF